MLALVKMPLFKNIRDPVDAHGSPFGRMLKIEALRPYSTYIFDMLPYVVFIISLNILKLLYAPHLTHNSELMIYLISSKRDV